VFKVRLKMLSNNQTAEIYEVKFVHNTLLKFSLSLIPALQKMLIGDYLKKQ
jgi:hypothetical protein